MTECYAEATKLILYTICIFCLGAYSQYEDYDGLAAFSFWFICVFVPVIEVATLVMMNDNREKMEQEVIERKQRGRHARALIDIQYHPRIVACNNPSTSRDAHARRADAGLASATYWPSFVPMSAASAVAEGKIATMSRARCRRTCSMLNCILCPMSLSIVWAEERIVGMSLSQKDAMACCVICGPDFALVAPGRASPTAVRARFRGRS